MRNATHPLRQRALDADAKLRHFGLELRAADDGAPEGTLVGYATVYDSEYRIGWGITEEIAPGCFDRSIADQNGIIPIFYQHDWDNPIGHATVTSDAKGVKVVVTLYIDDNERARSVWLAAKAGALRQWSIGFYPITIEITVKEDGTEVERIIEGDLAEASIVVRGANPDTEMIDVRNKPEIETPAEPKLDAEGNPIVAEPVVEPTLDAEGNPIVAAADAAIDDETANLLAEHSDRAWCRDELRLIHKAV